MGKYQPSKKDSKFNNRFHDQLRRDTRAQKNEQLKVAKAAEVAKAAAGQGTHKGAETL